MKRYGWTFLLLGGIFLLHAAINRLLVGSHNLTDHLSLFLFQSERFSELRLALPNINQMILFLLPIWVLFSVFTRDTLEAPSYISLMLYRQGRRAFLKQETARLLRQAGILWLGCTVLTLLFCWSFSGFSTQNLPNNLLGTALFFLRTLLLLATFTMLYKLASLDRFGSFFFLAMQLGYLLLMIADSVFALHLVTYSGSVSSEVVCTLVTLLAVALAYGSAAILFFKKEDLL